MYIHDHVYTHTYTHKFISEVSMHLSPPDTDIEMKKLTYQ